MTEYSRRDALRILGGSLVAGLAGCGSSPPTETAPAIINTSAYKLPEKPNILFIMCDQLRPHELDTYGVAPYSNPSISTPNISRLASDGVIFTNAFAANPHCTPNRGSLITGKYPWSMGLTGNEAVLPTTVESIAHATDRLGYKTGYIGKWHLYGEAAPGFVPPGPDRQGFDYWAAFNSGHYYFGSQYFTDSPVSIKPKGYEPYYQTGLATQFIEDNKDVPFHLHVSFGPPHHPHKCPQEFFDMIEPAALSFLKNVPVTRRSTAREWLHGYLACTLSIDYCVGLLIDKLKEAGVYGKTIVCFTSDHGDMNYSHNFIGKRMPFDECTRVPLVISCPDAFRKKYIGFPVSSIDIAPTLLGLIGTSFSQSIHGRDLSSRLLTRANSAPGDYVLMQGVLPEVFLNRLGQPDLEPMWTAVRTEKWLFARTIDDSFRMLFHLRNDPFQTRNLAGLPEHAATEAHLDSLLDAPELMEGVI